MSVSRRFARGAFATLVGAVLLLTLVSFWTEARAYLHPGDLVSEALAALDQGPPGIPWLSVDREQSIPAWLSSSMLLLSGVLLASLSTRAVSGRAWQWRVLAVIFLLLSLDEAVGFHERAIGPVRSALDTEGFLYYAWVIPGAVLVIAVALVYARFVLALPHTVRWLVILAAALFVGGALGSEAFAAYQAAEAGQATLAYVVVSTIEELLEMLGIAVFLYALMLLAVAPSAAGEEPIDDRTLGATVQPAQSGS
jgi:hypothetical protein